MSTDQSGNDSEHGLDRVFGALSDRTRRRILARLMEGPAPISELAEPFAMTLAAVGKHVKVLQSAGLVRRRIVGRAHVCALEPEALHTADKWLACYRDYWTGSLESLADYVEAMNDR